MMGAVTTPPGFSMPAALLLCVVLSPIAAEADATPAQTTASANAAPADEQTAAPDIDAGIAFLKQAQRSDGGWGERERVGVSALAVAALLRSGVPADDPTVADALQFLRGNAREDGGMYGEGTNHRNYDTALSLMALKQADLPEDRERLSGAVGFLAALQWDESEGVGPGDTSFGGAGYGSHSRPDLSNTQVFVEALKQAGMTADDPAMQKALVFVSRTQNLESEHNRTEFAGLVGDGGFYYTPADGGSSQAGQTPNGGLRSYASMTYAGLKSMVYAGLDRDDPRVKAATEWIRKHYTLDENPGLDQQGLFYYYLTFAKTMDALGVDRFEDADGTAHDWRADLRGMLAKKQSEDGSWSNPADRWMEGDPVLVTAYALTAASFALDHAKMGER